MTWPEDRNWNAGRTTLENSATNAEPNVRAVLNQFPNRKVGLRDFRGFPVMDPRRIRGQMDHSPHLKLRHRCCSRKKLQNQGRELRLPSRKSLCSPAKKLRNQKRGDIKAGKLEFHAVVLAKDSMPKIRDSAPPHHFESSTVRHSCPKGTAKLAFKYCRLRRERRTTS